MTLKLFFFVVLGVNFSLCWSSHHGNYNCEEGRDVFVHLFEWKWTDIAKECEEFLAPYGFCGLQTSPAMEHRVIVNDSHHPGISYPWWQRYQPVSYKMTSRSGSEDEFKDMVQRCNAVGVRVYADTILNHMTQPGSGRGSAGSLWSGDNDTYPAVPYKTENFHGSDVCPTSDLNIHDYQDSEQVRNCRLNGLRDLQTEDDYVREMEQEYLNKLISWGVAGFRIDAAKHMYPDDVEAVMDGLNDLNTNWFPNGTRPYIYQEVIDLGGEPIKNTDYTHIGRVTEFKYGMNLGDVVRGNLGPYGEPQKLIYLKNFGEEWGFIASDYAIAFMDNHDNQRGHGAGGFDRILTFHEANLYKIAIAFELAWTYGHIRLMSSYDWPRDPQNGVDVNDWMGPPSDSNGNTKNVSCFDDWICEHRWRQIYNMVRFHNVALDTTEDNWWDNGNNAIAFSRGSKAFIAINNENYSISQSFNTGLPDGTYCDVISCDNNIPPCGNSGGGCRSQVTVSGGYAYITVPSGEDPMIAIHV